jgi:XTP/dITP diphosphohydrolase
MRRLVFATHNRHKLEEVSQLLGNEIEILGLADLGCLEEIPETADTLEGNALQKSDYVYNHYGVDCFSDDTGLEIEALQGAPGVYSARYAGADKDSGANMQKVLRLMEGVENRKARFRTVISLILGGKQYQLDGIVTGEILRERRGAAGFGYDPIFQPDGYDQSFAELGDKAKNQISHRAKAIESLRAFLDALPR